jgi:hypothetical protein
VAFLTKEIVRLLVLPDTKMSFGSTAVNLRNRIGWHIKRSEDDVWILMYYSLWDKWFGNV